MLDPLLDPPREFSLMPFWFWNDVLEEREILRQVDEMERNGVYGFVIHPRVGLPRDCGWMSDKLLGVMRVAIDEAERRGMKVILYDEGMYPSGSSCGQVVARSPELACRCLALHDASQPLPEGANVVQKLDQRRWVIDRKLDSYIRGLHYIDEGPAEDEPPAGDILNPATTKTVLELVHDRFAQHFGDHFGKTVLGVFTDEPSSVGKCRETHVIPGTTGILEHVNRLLGYDFRPHLAKLWSGAPEDKPYRDAWQHAIRLRLNETWFAPLSAWCKAHGIALCGHPDRGDEIGAQRYFHVPGQDLVWRWVEPGKPSGIEGHEATQAKCSSSAMIHLGRRRNSNEFAGAYGAQTTFDEVRALANWCLVRGVNLLIPHAFYYSVRGVRRDERPPQIGPHTPQWNTPAFKAFADTCRRLSWLNTDSRHLCHVAVLTHNDECPWRAAAALLSAQCDFNYLDPDTLLHHATVDADGIRIRDMCYSLLVLDGDFPLAPAVREKLAPIVRGRRVFRFVPGAEAELCNAARRHAPSNASLPQCDSPQVRVRQVEKLGHVYTLIFNEGFAPATVRLAGDAVERIDPATGESVDARHPLDLAPFELCLLRTHAGRGGQ